MIAERLEKKQNVEIKAMNDDNVELNGEKTRSAHCNTGSENLHNEDEGKIKKLEDDVEKLKTDILMKDADPFAAIGIRDANIQKLKEDAKDQVVENAMVNKL